MERSGDILRLTAFAIGITVTIHDLIRVIACSLFADKDFSDEKYQDTQMVLIALAVINCIELFFDALLLFGMHKKIYRLMLIWVVSYVAFMFINFGLCGRLISISYTSGTDNVTVPLYIYTICNALTSIIFIVIVKFYSRQVYYHQMRGTPIMPSAVILLRRPEY